MINEINLNQIAEGAKELKHLKEALSKMPKYRPLYMGKDTIDILIDALRYAERAKKEATEVERLILERTDITDYSKKMEFKEISTKLAELELQQLESKLTEAESVKRVEGLDREALLREIRNYGEFPSADASDERLAEYLAELRAHALYLEVSDLKRRDRAKEYRDTFTLEQLRQLYKDQLTK